MRILIAEDEVSIAKALQLMLEKNKYSVDVVHNGTDALDYICAGEYDALVLDIMMPGMDGISVLTEARRRGVTTPALFLTAKSEVEDRIAGLDAGADDYLPKPFAAGEFLARVRALVRRSSAYAPDVLSFGGTSVIFLNSERELHAIRALFWITAAVAGGCLVIVFLLVLLFSRRAIAPYIRNLAMQKQFITNASHELKTPLTTISTSADVLAMEYENDEWVKNIQSQSVRLSRLISDLVTLSRLDEENPFPERAEFSLSDAVWETAEPFTALARSRGRSYSQNIEDGLTMTGDRAAVQQMVSILLDNANKYTPEGGSIFLSARRAGRKNEIAVSNTCEGAESIDVTRLFDRFYRADESHSTRIGGTGIGLSIARATAEAHGGTIEASVSGDTITFRVKI